MRSLPLNYFQNKRKWRLTKYNWITNESNINDGDFKYPRLEDYEKFAELIVSDIVGAIRGLQVSAQEDGMLNAAATCGTIAELIEIDYGIEE